jgi:hypothetical protein
MTSKNNKHLSFLRFVFTFVPFKRLVLLNLFFSFTLCYFGSNNQFDDNQFNNIDYENNQLFFGKCLVIRKHEKETGSPSFSFVFFFFIKLGAFKFIFNFICMLQQTTFAEGSKVCQKKKKCIC